MRFSRIFFTAIVLIAVFSTLTGSVLAETSLEKNKTAENIIEERKCRRCHTLHGEGGMVGPDLSNVGARRDPEWLKKLLRRPRSITPGTPMPPFKGTEEELETLVAYLASLK
ncbi:MAG: c-type cytochrome [Nitrospiria bacterium]